MSILADIEKIQSRTVVLTFFNLLFLVTPGVALIFLLANDVFYTLDWVKLMLVSVMITTPFAFWNTVLFFTSEDGSDNNESHFFASYSIGITVTALMVYAATGIAYTFQRTIFEMYMAMVGIELIALMYLAGKDWLKKK